MPIPKCPIHHIELTCASCRAAAAGAANKGVPLSRAKARAAKRNGRRGGRPPNHAPGCDLLAKGRYTPDCPRCEYDQQRARAC